MRTFVTDRLTDGQTDGLTDGADYIGPEAGPKKVVEIPCKPYAQ